MNQQISSSGLWFGNRQNSHMNFVLFLTGDGHIRNWLIPTLGRCQGVSFLWRWVYGESPLLSLFFMLRVSLKVAQVRSSCSYLHIQDLKLKNRFRNSAGRRTDWPPFWLWTCKNSSPNITVEDHQTYSSFSVMDAPNRVKLQSLVSTDLFSRDMRVFASSHFDALLSSLPVGHVEEGRWWFTSVFHSNQNRARI